MGAFNSWFARNFGARPNEPRPNDPVELRPWLDQVEAGTVMAMLTHHGIDSWWPAGDSSLLRRLGAIVTRGPVIVRRCDLDEANAVLDGAEPIELGADERTSG